MGIVFMDSGATSTDGLLQRWRTGALLLSRFYFCRLDLDSMERMWKAVEEIMVRVVT
jgi:hypothetical protein